MPARTISYMRSRWHRLQQRQRPYRQRSGPPPEPVLALSEKPGDLEAVRALSKLRRQERAASRDLTCCICGQRVAQVDPVRGGRPRRYCSTGCRRRKEGYLRWLAEVEPLLAQAARSGYQDSRVQNLRYAAQRTRELVERCEARP
jgi:hypothetical protein